MAYTKSQRQSVQASVGRCCLLAIYRSCTAGPGGRVAETVSKVVRRSILPPLLREVEERAGERRGVFIGNSPLLNPLPARSSRGEEEAKLSFETVSAAPPYPLHRLSLEIGMSQPLSSHTFLDPLFQLSCTEAAGSTACFFGNKFANKKATRFIIEWLYVKLDTNQIFRLRMK